MIFSGCVVGTLLVKGRIEHYVVSLPSNQWADGDGVLPCPRELALRFCVRELNGEMAKYAEVVSRKIPRPEVPRSVSLSREIALILAKRG